MRTGALGYVVKSDAAREPLPAIEAVLEGQQFVISGLADRDFSNPSHEGVGEQVVVPHPVEKVEIVRRHEVGFYSDDRAFVDDLTQFIGIPLKARKAAVVVATESHRDSLIAGLQAYPMNLLSTRADISRWTRPKWCRPPWFMEYLMQIDL